MKFWLKACPKCGGDLEVVEEIFETYVGCLQCGLELTLVQEKVLRMRGRVPVAPRAHAPALFPEGRHHKTA